MREGDDVCCEREEVEGRRVEEPLKAELDWR